MVYTDVTVQQLWQLDHLRQQFWQP